MKTKKCYFTKHAKIHLFVFSLSLFSNLHTLSLSLSPSQNYILCFSHIHILNPWENVFSQMSIFWKIFFNSSCPQLFSIWYSPLCPTIIKMLLSNKFYLQNSFCNFYSLYCWPSKENQFCFANTRYYFFLI